MRGFYDWSLKPACLAAVLPGRARDESAKVSIGGDSNSVGPTGRGRHKVSSDRSRPKSRDSQGNVEGLLSGELKIYRRLHAGPRYPADKIQMWKA